MEKLKVVQIGVCHDHGTSGFNSILRQPEYFEVLGFAVTPEELKEEPELCKQIITEYRDERHVPMYTVEDALHLPDVEAAVVETREQYLNRYALMAAKAGLHIYMDKPGGWDVSEFETLVEEVKERKLAFSIGYMYRFNPKIMEIKERIRRGEIGEVYSIEAHMDCEHNPANRQRLANFPGGMMFFLGCHLIDLIYSIQGEPEEIYPMNCATGFDGVTADDYGMVVYRYKNGISFAKSCAKECGGYMRRQLVVCGSKGTFELKPLEAFEPGTERDYLYTEMREVGENKGWQFEGLHTKTNYFNRFDAMLRNFADVAKGRKENPYTYDYELALFQLLLKSCAHIDEGRN